MSWIIESPWPILAVGVFVVAILWGVYTQTRHPRAIYAAIGAVALFGGLLALERVILTEREVVEQTLFQIAAALEANDSDEVLEHISPQSQTVRDDARRHMNLVDISRVNIKSNLKVNVQSKHKPPLAEATFNVVIVASDKAGHLVEQQIPRRLTVWFRKEADHWRVRDYRVEAPFGSRL